jgi:MFS family permease
MCIWYTDYERKSKNKNTFMIHALINRFLRHRHFWRHATFDELSQIYISSFFRMMAFSLVGIFIPLFLYDLDYSLGAIFGFYIAYFVARSVIHLPAGLLVARIGPKHTMIASFLLQLVSSLSFLTLADFSWPLWLVALIFAAASCLFFTAYHVDFSKVKHSEHGGKEMGFASIVQRIGGAIGPVVGGVVATVFGPQYIFLAMILLLLIALGPLLTSPEPVRVHQKIRFRNIRLRSIVRDLVSYTGLTISHQLSISLWPLYLGIFALGANAYLKLGGLSSVGFIVSIFTAYAIGKIVDRRRGRSLLRISAMSDVFIQAVKPFVNTLPFAFVVNTAGESSAVAMRISYQKGMYDAADDQPGNRIVYISLMETVGSVAKAIIWVGLLWIGYSVSFEIAIIVGFMLAALSNFLTVSERFKGL